jgi:hypothetical protein
LQILNKLRLLAAQAINENIWNINHWNFLNNKSSQFHNIIQLKKDFSIDPKTLTNIQTLIEDTIKYFNKGISTEIPTQPLKQANIYNNIPKSRSFMLAMIDSDTK